MASFFNLNQNLGSKSSSLPMEHNAKNEVKEETYSDLLSAISQANPMLL